MSDRQQLQEAITLLSAQRARFGDATVETAVGVLEERLAALPAQPEPAAAELPAGEQRKQVTVLFAVIEGFTRLAGAAHNTERLRQIDLLWRRLDETILYHGGVVDKHMGDVVMGIFGVPAARENDPERAVRCAIAMRELVSESPPAWSRDAESSGRELTIRIGINTGLVSLGQLGSDDGLTAIGDAVNVASRLNEASAGSGVYVSQDTYRLVRDLFRVEPLGAVTVKGRRMPVTAYRIVGSRPRVFFRGAEGLEGVRTPMIGRASEIAHLQGVLVEAAQTGRGRLITILGDAGVGKSRLVREFDRWLETFPAKATIFQGRTDQRLMQVPYSLMRDLLIDHFGIEEGDRTGLIEDKLARALAGAKGVDELPMVAGQAAALSQLISLGLPAPGAEDVSGLERLAARAQAVDALLTYLREVAQRSAVTLFFLEDIHWADEDSLALLQQVAALAAEAPLIMICMARPLLLERAPHWAGGEIEGASSLLLTLQPLSEAESRELVFQILRKLPQIPPALADLIVRSAAGNPFYVEELVRVLIEDGVIVPGETTWQLRPRELTRLRVPATLTGVLQARLDRLPELERVTLQQAAVIGDEFWDSAVQQINLAARSPYSREQVAAALQSLEQRDMIYRVPTPVFSGSQAYLFKHAILREVAYESVLLRERPGYHLQAARWLQAQSGDRLAEYAAPIAQHHEQAGQPAEAARLYELAADLASEQYRLGSAVDYYRQALALLKDLPQYLDARLGVQERLGRVLQQQGRLVEALYTYHAMQRIAELDGNLLGQARAENALAAVLRELGDDESALAAAGRAEQLARLTGAEVELIRALLGRAESGSRLGQPGLAELAAEAVERSRVLDARRDVIRSLATMAAVAGKEEAEQAAAELGTYAVTLAGQDNPDDAALALARQGEAYLRLGQAQAARGPLARALELQRAAGNQSGAAESLRLLGLAACRAGAPDAAVDHLEEAGALAETTGYRYLRLLCRLALAEALLARGQTEAAEATVRGVITAAGDSQRLGTWRNMPEARALLARILARQGRGDEANGGR